jgi:hypothetical protein
LLFALYFLRAPIDDAGAGPHSGVVIVGILLSRLLWVSLPLLVGSVLGGIGIFVEPPRHALSAIGLVVGVVAFGALVGLAVGVWWVFSADLCEPP